MKRIQIPDNDKLIAGAGILFACAIALDGFMTKPGLWFDEGITIEIARNFALFGQLDVLTSPGVFSGLAYLVGTNGFPVTLPLAMAFTLFGTSLLVARILALVWLIAALMMVYTVARRIYGGFSGAMALCLAATYASLYGNGLTATGEMPGIVFFMLGIYLLVVRRSYALAGVAWGMAMAAKPGVFLLLAHTAVLYILIADRGRWFRKLCEIGFGALIPISIWVALAFPITMGTFYSVVSYTLNPIDIPAISGLLDSFPQQTLNDGLIIPASRSAAQNTHMNLMRLLTEPTLLYFELLTLLVVSGLYLARKEEFARKMLCITIIYGMLVLFYFIRGPGWNRYLIGFQVVLFVSVYPAILAWTRTVKGKYVAYMPAVAKTCAGILIVFQLFQLLFLSKIPEAPRTYEAVSRIGALMQQYPQSKVGIYNIPELAAFTDPARTYHRSLPQEGLAPLGGSPLLLKELPTFVVVSKKHSLLSSYEESILKARYARISSIPKFEAYELMLQP